MGRILAQMGHDVFTAGHLDGAAMATRLPAGDARVTLRKYVALGCETSLIHAGACDGDAATRRRAADVVALGVQATAKEVLIMGKADVGEQRVFERLDELWNRALPELPLADAKYAIMSDIHLGNGKWADDFRNNKAVLQDALKWYDENEYALILLGDVEELWQFDMSEITGPYDKIIYEPIRNFGVDRLHRVFGNHDVAWGSPIDPVIRGSDRSRGAPEGLKLLDDHGRPRMLLIHGHQGTKDSDEKMWASRFWVRALWRRVEPVVRKLRIYRNPSEPKSRGITKAFERVRHKWAESRKVVLICGHTHRAIFASESRSQILARDIAARETQLQADPDGPEAARLKSEIDAAKAELRDERKKGRDIVPMSESPIPCYFNTGCGLYTEGITAIELDQNEMKLVKWDARSGTTSQRRELRTGNTGQILDRVGAGH